MELVEVENENETKSEVDSDDSDVSEENDDNNEEDSEKSDDEEVEEDVDEKPEDEDIIPESEEVNYNNKERRRTTIISIDKEELEDIFKDNTIDEEDVEVPEDKSEAGSDDNEDAEDTDEDNEGLWLRFQGRSRKILGKTVNHPSHGVLHNLCDISYVMQYLFHKNYIIG